LKIRKPPQIPQDLLEHMFSSPVLQIACLYRIARTLVIHIWTRCSEVTAFASHIPPSPSSLVDRFGLMK
jgi:hypothetical protein